MSSLGAAGELDISPWPLHPPPRPQEALTSWMRRTCTYYGLARPADLLPGFEISGLDMDRYVPEPLLAHLAAHSTVPVPRLRSMTLSGWIPWLLDDTDPARCDFDTYVHQFSVLLPADLATHDRLCRTPAGGTWLPWVSEQRTRACPVCVDELECTADIGVTLVHQLSLLTSCPAHGCRLEFCTVLPGRAVLWDRTASDERLRPIPVSQEVARLDRRSARALTSGWVQLDRDRVHAAVWFRVLRSVVDDVCTPLCRSGRWSTVLSAIWNSTGHPRPPQASRMVFEHLRWTERERVVAAAASAISAIERGDLPAGGAHARLLAPIPDEPVDPGTAPTRSCFPAREHSAWDGVQDAIDAAVEVARSDIAAAASLFAFLRTGCHTPEGAARLQQVFADLGIRLPP
ncbi:TniQ family protein [Rhodococcoides kroppenstedtii]|uniref:TniQ family protein n=1 Tax=Rhodococcoides kroppenstedtii TaxID=293050 RepID=UPI0028E3F405|nr:TniQ family protein [Rhodococcus kroppenstedtii]